MKEEEPIPLVQLLGEMMASVHKNDYTLVVMTPNYAEKANQGQGKYGK